MKTPRLQPIPTPPLQRLQHFKTTFLPGLVFCGALMITGILWRDRFAAPTMVGPVVGAQLEVLPPALQSVKLAGAELGLPVNIHLPTALNLRPGELVDLGIIPSTQ